jgi:hypothetical protein
LSQSLFSSLFCVALALTSVNAEIFPSAGPATRSASSANSTRILALGEPRFSDSQVFNLFDQGGSPMGLLETRREKVGVSFGYRSGTRSSSGDTLALERSDLILPQVGFYQPGVFGVNLYFLSESEAFERMASDTVETSSNLFGLDFAAGPASGLFRVGFSAHGRMGTLEYPGDAKRVLVSVPSLRFDLGSRFHPAAEVGVFGGIDLQFDSLQSPLGHLERAAQMTIPKYGFLADLGGTEEWPMLGNVVFEIGTHRQFGEYRVMNDSGVQFPTIFTDFLTFQTQWLYPLQVDDFKLQPAVRFAYRSEKAQGYLGLKGNQDPFKKGAEIPGLKADRGINDFGLGGQFGYQEWISLLTEWETAGHSYKSDSTRDERYHRFAIGVENHVDKLPFEFPDAVNLTLRLGWAWHQEGKSMPGDKEYQFDPFLPVALPNNRGATLLSKPASPAALSAFTLGFDLGLFENKFNLDGFLSLPEQLEQVQTKSLKTSGLEFGVTVTYRLL